jgi:hypothetical protein
LNQQENIVAILLDLSKAFDHVNHGIILDILNRYGVRGIPNKWFETYLKQREQCVSVSTLNHETRTMLNIKSDNSLTESGVPQGSILGPILFLLYVNYLPQILSNKIIMFADDISILFKFKRNDTEGLNNQITNTLSTVVNWLSMLNLTTNINKTKCIHFRNLRTERARLKSTNLSVLVVNEAKFLGIYVDESLNWKKRVDFLCNKLSSFTFALKGLKNISTQKAALQAYHAFFQSHVLYGLAIWGSCTEVHRLFILQKRCVRILNGIKSNHESCRPSFKKLGLPTLSAMYIIELCKLVRRHVSKFPAKNNFNSDRLNAMFAHDIRAPPATTAIYQRSTIYVAVKVFNTLPVEIKSLNHTKFFTALKKFVIELCPYSLSEYYNVNC